MTTWAAVTKEIGTQLVDSINLLGLQTCGYFSWDASASTSGWESTTAYTDTEMLIYLQSLGHLMPYVSGYDEDWVGATKQTTTWSETSRRGSFGSGTFGGESFGGTVWTSVVKDS